MELVLFPFFLFLLIKLLLLAAYFSWFVLIGPFLIIVVIASICGLYFLPSFIAFAPARQNRYVIAILNVFTGWSLAGWGILLIWACLSPRIAVQQPEDDSVSRNKLQ